METIMYIVCAALIAAVIWLLVSRFKESRAKKLAETKANHPTAKAARDTKFATGGRVATVDPILEASAEDRRAFITDEAALRRKANIAAEYRIREAEAVAAGRRKTENAAEEDRHRHADEEQDRRRQEQIKSNEYDLLNKGTHPYNQTPDYVWGTVAVAAVISEDTHNHQDDDSSSKQEEQPQENTSSSEEYTGIPAYGGSDDSSSSSSSSSDYSSSSDSSSSYSSSSDSSSSSYDSGSSSSGGGDW